MQSQSSQEIARFQRLFAACQRGLNHDLTNQLVALQGLLQLLEMDEFDRLTPTGQEYLKRLKSVGQRTLSLARTLRDLTRVVEPATRPEVVHLPTLVDEILDTMVPPPARKAVWDEPRVLAPPEAIRQALGIVLALLVELHCRPVPFFLFAARQCDGMVECSVSPSPANGTSTPLNPQAKPVPTPLPNPDVWHDKLECLLLRELAESWGGAASWRWQQSHATVVLTIPLPPSSVV
jgi:hypothetical protein